MQEYPEIADENKADPEILGLGAEEMDKPVSYSPRDSVHVDEDEELDFVESGVEERTQLHNDSSSLRDYLLSHLTPLFLEKARGKPHLVVWAKQRRLEISLPIGSPTTARAGIETCIPLSGFKNRALDTVLSELARQTPYEEELKPIGQGIHFIEDTLVAMSGGRILVLDPATRRWKERPEPELTGYRPYLQPEEWLPWNEYELNLPPSQGVEKVIQILTEAVNNGWGFEQGSVDAIQFVLGMGAQILGCLWRQQVIMHINASSSSGKSRLLGLCTGRAPSLESKALIPNNIFITDGTAPGIIGKLQDSRMTLLLDEAEVSGSKNMEDLLALIRSASGAGSIILRGRREGGHRSAQLTFGAILASIEPVLSLQRDRNRSLVCELTRDVNRDDPWIDFERTLKRYGVTGAELSRCWFIHLTANFDSVRENYLGLIKDRPAELKDLPQRRAEVLSPLLAIGSLGSLEMRSTLKTDLANLVRLRDTTGWSVGEVADLHDTLFNGPFSVNAGFDNQGRQKKRDTTVMQLVSETNLWTAYPEAGIYLQPYDDVYAITPMKFVLERTISS